MEKPNKKVSSQLYQDIYEAAPFGIYTLDKDGYITSFNPKMQELSGDKPEQAIGLNALTLDSYKKVGLDKYFRKAIYDGESFETEVEYVSHVGKKLSIRHYRGIPVSGANKSGKTRLLLIVEDVTEKRYIEKKLANSRQEERLEHERLLLLINSMGDAVVATDNRGKITVYNGAALELLNTNENLQDQPINKFLHTYDKNKDKIDLLDVVRKSHQTIKRDDILFRVENQDFMNLYVNLAPIYVSYGSKTENGFIFLLRDITKEKSIEAQRDEFVSVTSHELRTPIATAEASISTAMTPEVINQPEKVSKMLDQAHKNIIFLGELVADLTTLAKAERGLLGIDVAIVDPQKILEQIEANHQSAAVKKGLEFLVEFDDDTPSIKSSEYHIMEILQNLVTNAIKYTPKGTVKISAKPSLNYKKGVLFTVEDTGIGISTHDKKRIFDKFYRSEDYRTRETSGTGLGLYVSKRLSQRLNGKLSFESKLDEGSTFLLDIPEVKRQIKQAG